MVYPDKERFCRDSGTFNMIPVFEELRADFETPISLFKKTGAKFLLESIEQGENVGRYSIMGIGEKATITLTGQKICIDEFKRGEKAKKESFELQNPLDRVREYFKQFKVPDYKGLPPFFGGAVGFLGYETIQYFEDIPANDGDTSIPDGLMIIPEVLLIYDTVRRSVSVIVSVTPGEDPGSSYDDALKRIAEVSAALKKTLDCKEPVLRPGGEVDFRSNMEKERFLECVNKCKEYIKDGEIIQVVFSQKFKLETNASPFELYRTLRILNPSPYLFFMDFDDFCIVGSSPEVMIRVQDKEVLLKPIAGTRPRGKTLAQDNDIARELLNDPKERAEHMMLVDLGRNDLGRIAMTGSVEVTDYMAVEKYSHVMHIVSTIKGILDEEYDVFDVVRATFPAGTLTGAPKIRAMEIIAELEPDKRGPYGGMVFNLGFNGNMDSCIVIRTLVLKQGKAIVQAGAGIVADSVPENEFKESLNKAMALIETVRLTEQGGADDTFNRQF